MIRKPKNTGIADKFPPESSEKSGKIMDTERKISHTARKKLENDSKGEEKMPGNGKRRPKIAGFSLEKNSGKALKTREWDEKNGRQYPQNTKDSRWKIKITGKNTAGACTKQVEKILRELKNAEIADKKTTGGIRKM